MDIVNFVKGFFVKVDGAISHMNVFNFLMFIIGAVEVLKPFIPTEYLPALVSIVGLINVYLRTYQSSGVPLKASE